MNERAKHLPKWVQDFVADHPQLKDGMLTPEFNGKVYIQFEDESHILFNYAFLVECRKHKEIAVFTEHCGYHCFSTKGLSAYTMLGRKPHSNYKEKHGS
jgi:hypothetical protein